MQHCKRFFYGEAAKRQCIVYKFGLCFIRILGWMAWRISFAATEKSSGYLRNLLRKCGTVNDSSLLKWSLALVCVCGRLRLFEKKIYRWQFVRNKNIFSLFYASEFTSIWYGIVMYEKNLITTIVPMITFFWMILRSSNCSFSSENELHKFKAASNSRLSLTISQIFIRF